VAPPARTSKAGPAAKSGGGGGGAPAFIEVGCCRLTL
jgi:hypothetical protein